MSKARLATKTKTQEPVVTAVAGPSWLNRLGLRYGETSLGRSGATYGPPPTQRPSPPRRGAVGGWTTGRTERRRPVPAQLSVLPSGRRHGITSGDQIRSWARAGIVARTGTTAPAEGGDGVRSIGGAHAGHSSAGRPLSANSEGRATDAGACAPAGSRHQRRLRLPDTARRRPRCATAVAPDHKLGSARRARRQGHLPHLP